MSDGVREKRRICRKTCDKPHYPYELPKGWCWTTLGEISNYGTTINIQVENIEKNEWILELEDVEKETANIIQKLSKGERSVKGTRHKFNTGDILYSKLRTYLNKVLVATSEGYCTTEIMPLNTYGIMSNEYVCHVLRSPFFLDYTLQCGYGVKMPRLSTTDACNGFIPLPPLKEQIRIVEEIRRWFALIDIIESGKDDLQETIKQTKSKILNLAIHGKLVPQDPNDEPATELLKRINPKAENTCDTPQYENLPNGWCWTTIEEIGEIVTGSTPSKDIEAYYGGNIPFFKPADLEQGIHTASSKDRLTSLGFEQSRKLPIGSILVTCIGATIGKTGLTVIEGACNQQINAIIPRNVILPHYLYCICISDYMQNEIKTNASATTLPILNKGNFSKIILPLPPLQEQHRIFAKIEELFAQLDNIASSL